MESHEVDYSLPPMKVKDLVEKLKDFDSDMEVLVEYEGSAHTAVYAVARLNYCGETSALLIGY